MFRDERRRQRQLYLLWFEQDASCRWEEWSNEGSHFLRRRESQPIHSSKAAYNGSEDVEADPGEVQVQEWLTVRHVGHHHFMWKDKNHCVPAGADKRRLVRKYHYQFNNVEQILYCRIKCNIPLNPYSDRLTVVTSSNTHYKPRTVTLHYIFRLIANTYRPLNSKWS